MRRRHLLAAATLPAVRHSEPNLFQVASRATGAGASGQRPQAFRGSRPDDADRKDILSKVRVAFETGQPEVMLMSFPSDFCTDGGRRVNNRLPGWQDTLPGRARALHGFWRDALRPGGFGFGARILNFPAGVLGDVGLFVTWPQSGA